MAKRTEPKKRAKLLQVITSSQLETHVRVLRERWECTASEAVRRAVREAAQS